DRPSSAAVVDPEGVQGAIASLELQENLERERRKRHSREKHFIRIWKVTRLDLPEFSFLSPFEDEEADDLSSGSDS
ncbi:hypothetical protein HAX54_038793, partial [Datura stramonium]|nr:hypothetical protein [Datura stramonium]